MRRSFMKATAISALIAASGMSARAAAIHQMGQREALKPMDATKKDEFEKRMERSSNPYKRSRPNFCGNQREYRKKCRQNPCHYHSKKHRANN